MDSYLIIQVGRVYPILGVFRIIQVAFVIIYMDYQTSSDKGSNGSRKTIFFFPGYINRIGYYNKDGVSDVIGAMLSEIKYSGLI